MIASGNPPPMLALFAVALPVLHVLLAVDLALLAATVAMALRLLTRVRIRTRIATQDEAQEDGENFEPEPEPYTRPSFTLIPPQPQPPLQQRPQSQPRSRPPAAEQTLLPLGEAIEPTRPQYEEPPPQVPGSPVQFFEETALGGIVADPIDGAPFHAGETILVCRCGAGYHQETGAWLREHLAGKCVHCGVAHTLEPRLLEPRAQSVLRH